MCGYVGEEGECECVGGESVCVKNTLARLTAADSSLTDVMVCFSPVSLENPRLQSGHFLVAWTFSNDCRKNDCDPFTVE